MTLIQIGNSFIQSIRTSACEPTSRYGAASWGWTEGHINLINALVCSFKSLTEFYQFNVIVTAIRALS